MNNKKGTSEIEYYLCSQEITNEHMLCCNLLNKDKPHFYTYDMFLNGSLVVLILATLTFSWMRVSGRSPGIQRWRGWWCPCGPLRLRWPGSWPWGELLPGRCGVCVRGGLWASGRWGAHMSPHGVGEPPGPLEKGWGRGWLRLAAAVRRQAAAVGNGASV